MPYITLQEVIDDINTYIIQNSNKSISGSHLNDVLNGLGAFVSESLISSSYAYSASYAVSASRSTTSSYAIIATSANLAVTASYYNTSSLTQISDYNSFTASYLVSSASFANTGSNIFRGNQTITGSVSVSGSSSFNGRVAGNNAIALNEFVTLAQISASTANGYQIISSSTSVTTYPNGIVLVQSGSSNNVSFSVSGSGSFTGDVKAQAFYEVSARQFKENILPFSSSALDLINSLDIVSYNYKKHRGQFKIGIIADDTHEYISTRDHNVLDNSNSIGILFKAIQELYKIIDEKIG